MPIPFHYTSEFLVLPRRWRMLFLKLNPAFRVLVGDVWAAQEAAEEVYRLFGESSTMEKAADAWEDLWLTPHSPCRRAWTAAGILANQFYVVIGPSRFDPLFGPPAGLALGPSPTEALEFSDDPWDGLVKFGFPDIPLSQLSGETELNPLLTGSDPSPWAERIKSRATDQLADWVARVRPPGAEGKSWNELSVRQRREAVSALRNLRRELGVPLRRREADEYYETMLSVWCLREGWAGDRYDPHRAVPLRRALIQAGAGGRHRRGAQGPIRPRYELYWRAFRLITGQPYSSLAWEIWFGPAWLEAFGPERYRRLRSRREAGRPRRQKAETGSRRKMVAVGSLAAREAPDPEAEARIAKFCQLVHQGGDIELAIGESALPDWVSEMLLDPANRAMVNAWADQERAG